MHLGVRDLCAAWHTWSSGAEVALNGAFRDADGPIALRELFGQGVQF